jgi:cardiolipin synthase A/B
MQSPGYEFSLTARDAWAAMYEDCLNAKESIDIEQYLFLADEVGKPFLELFLRKARNGVKVRMLCDMVGSFDLYDALDPEKLAEVGVRLQFYNPIAPWRLEWLASPKKRQSILEYFTAGFMSWFFRDHRKLLVVDRKIAHTGGVCIDYRMRDWRDTNVRLRLPVDSTGSPQVVDEMQQSFNRMWEITEKKNFLRFKKPIENLGFSFLTNAPHRNQRFLYDRLLSAIQSATHHIYLTTPYFIPDRKLFRTLRSASRRAIDVRLLVNARSDHRMVDLASQSHFASALRAGMKIYLYNENNIIHAKTAIIDDRIAFVGSGNLDNLSLLLNNEADLCAVNNPQFAKDLKQQFLNDADNSRILRASEWKKRPFLQKLQEFLTKPLHPLM